MSFLVNALLDAIAAKYNLNLTTTKRLSGGDINNVFLLTCPAKQYVVKVNHATKFPGMFAAEAKGLELLSQTNSFKIPKVIGTGTVGEESYLLLEYIPEGNPTAAFWESFATRLAQLHQTTQDQFGLDHDNYIGSLPQQNTLHDSVSEFYITQRMEPQFRLAADSGFHFKKLDLFFKHISDEIPEDPPALIHGDLWAGNYMVSKEVEPVLIDPAVAFAPREMDLGMMQLFGGFPQEVFEIYDSVFPLTPNWKQRMDIWQLYYLLVHLNLFGSGYLHQVKAVISKYL